MRQQDYEVRFRFTAQSDQEARQRIHQGNLGEMRVVNLGERQTAVIASRAVVVLILWAAILWGAWPFLLKVWRALP